MSVARVTEIISSSKKNFEDAVEKGYVDVATIEKEKAFQPVAGDPRFQAILRRLHEFHDRIRRTLLVVLALGPDPVGGIATGEHDPETGGPDEADQVETHEIPGARAAPDRAAERLNGRGTSCT